MTRKRLRIPMFFKFLAGCLTLAALLIIGGYLVVLSETQMKSRGNYLEKHFKRYLEYQEGLGQAVSTVAEVLAQDNELRAALTPPETADDDQPGQAASGEAARIAQEMFDKMSGKNSIRPDLFALVDMDGVVWSSDEDVIGPEDARELEPVARVLSGQPFYNKIFVGGGMAVQLAGVPIKARGGKNVVGGLLIGVDTTRYMLDYKRQSDSRDGMVADDSGAKTYVSVKDMQHQLTLVRDGKVVASVMPKEVWGELSVQLQEENWGYEKEGDMQRPVIRLKQGDYDFFEKEVEGFAGLEVGKVATLYLLRSRANLVGRGPTVPWVGIIIGAIGSIVIAGILAFIIIRPIRRFVEQSRNILEGGADLNQRIDIKARDETADLADNINQVFRRLYSLASEVQTAAFQVGASSAEISAASKQMLTGLKDQTFKIESSTAAVTELSASIQQVASNAVEASKVAEKSNVAVTSAVDRMQQIRGTVEDAAGKMRELGDSSKRIGNIVEVIRQISEQTSLLALNASIEAAHAGEQGRGFAVVADEVSSLAKRVGQSAKDIEALIQTVKEQTAEAVQSMDRGTREVEGGTELVTNTLRDLQQLIAVVNDTAAAVQEQAEVSDEIARNMDAVQKIAAELVHGSEEAVEQGEQLHSLAFGLEQSVGGFNLDGDRSSKPRPALTEAEDG